MRPAGIGGAPRPSFTPRPSFGTPEPNPMENGRAGRSERRNRAFGPDAKPARKRKPNYGGGVKTEMGFKKGPIRERNSGRLYGGLEDDGNDDDLNNDYMADFKERDEEDAV